MPSQPLQFYQGEQPNETGIFFYRSENIFYILRPTSIFSSISLQKRKHSLYFSRQTQRIPFPSSVLCLDRPSFLAAWAGAVPVCAPSSSASLSQEWLCGWGPCSCRWPSPAPLSGSGQNDPSGQNQMWTADQTIKSSSNNKCKNKSGDIITDYPTKNLLITILIISDVPSLE